MTTKRLQQRKSKPIIKPRRQQNSSKMKRRLLQTGNVKKLLQPRRKVAEEKALAKALKAIDINNHLATEQFHVTSTPVVNTTKKPRQPKKKTTVVVGDCGQHQQSEVATRAVSSAEAYIPSLCALTITSCIDIYIDCT